MHRNPDLSRDYQKARALIDDGRLDDAERILDRILAGRADDVFALNKKGVIEARRGNHQAASVYFQQVIALDPTNAPAWSNLGNNSLQMGQVDQAISQYERAIAIDPNYTIAYENLSAAYKQRGDLEQSVAVMKRTRLTRRSGGLLGRLLRFLRNMGT